MNRKQFLIGALALGLAVFFAARLVMFIFFPPPWTEEQPLQGWMTPGFVARMYDLPPHVLDPALQIDHEDGRKITLSEIAVRQGISFDELAARIDALVLLRRMIRDESLLALIPVWGAALLALVTFASCVALPVPASLLMLAGGAFAASGDLKLATLVLAAWGGAILGDQTGFHLGALVERRLQNRPTTKAVAARARDLVLRRPRFAIFITRWLLSPLGPYANIAAGAARMNWLTFTVPAALGEAVWVALYVGLGYAFGSEYDRIAALASNASGALASGVVAWLVFRRFGLGPAN